MAQDDNSSVLDALLAQSLAMQDYHEYMDCIGHHDPASTTNNTNTNSNTDTDHHHNPHSDTTAHRMRKTNPNALPKVLHKQCLPSVLSNYISSKSQMDISEDLNSVNPDIHALFLKYNYIYFDSKLSGCEVKWSKRMTLCAGLCCYEGHGGLCSIKLSSSLLKYRSTKEMIETLIHEMIHAYLFVSVNDRDRESHGDRFKTLMNVINYVSTLDISIYHTFHDEVDQYRKHVWKCNGACQHTPPYFGLVKRAMNRAPGPRDPWWPRHQQQCGGQYSKISEPPEFTEKQKKKREREQRRKMKQEGKDVEKKKTKTKSEKNVTRGGRKRKRVESVNGDDVGGTGKVRTLLDMFGSGDDGNANTVETTSKEPPRKKIKIDTKLKVNTKNNNGDESDIEILDVDEKNRKRETKVTCPICGGLWPESEINAHLDSCLS